MTINDLAKNLTLREGKKISLPIAQVKEVLRCLVDECQESDESYCVLLGYLVTARARGITKAILAKKSKARRK